MRNENPPPYQEVGKRKQASRFLQPVLVNLDLDDISIRPAIVGPDVFLLETHPIERLRRQAVAHLRELLGIRECAAQPLDLAHLAADVVRRADMAERRGLSHAHAVARLVARRDRGIVGSEDRKSTRLNSSHSQISYAVFCLKKK